MVRLVIDRQRSSDESSGFSLGRERCAGRALRLPEAYHLSEKRGWAALRLLVLAGFLAFAGFLAYELVVVAAGPRPSGPVALSEQLIMALGASWAMVRFALRARPQGRGAPWTLWFAAILFAVAFVIVAPYAFPEFAVLYAGSGLVGWAIGAVALWYDW